MSHTAAFSSFCLFCWIFFLRRRCLRARFRFFDASYRKPRNTHRAKAPELTKVIQTYVDRAKSAKKGIQQSFILREDHKLKGSNDYWNVCATFHLSVHHSGISRPNFGSLRAGSHVQRKIPSNLLIPKEAEAVGPSLLRHASETSLMLSSISGTRVGCISCACAHKKFHWLSKTSIDIRILEENRL